MSPTYLRIQRHFATSAWRVKMVRKIPGKETFLLSKVSTSTAFAFLLIICTPSWQQAAFCRHSNCNCQVMIILKTCKEMIWLWKASFLYAFVLTENRSTVNHLPVTAQLQPVTDHSPTSHWPVSTDRKPIAIGTINSCWWVSHQSLTSCKTYRRLIGYHKLIPNMCIMVSTIASQLQWNRTQPMCDWCFSCQGYLWSQLELIFSNLSQKLYDWNL